MKTPQYSTHPMPGVIAAVQPAVGAQSQAVVQTDERRKALFDRYLPRILQCRLEDLVSETPVQKMPLL